MTSETDEKTEKEFFDVLTHAISDSSKDAKDRRIEGLVELQRRIASNSIQNKDEAVRVLLDMAKAQGNNRPESSLIIESIILFIDRHEKIFQTVLNELESQEDRLFLCFSKVVLSLDYNKKRQSIRPLVVFLMTRDAVNDIGVKDVYDCLVSLGDEKLSRKIVEEASPYLDSSPSKICAIVFSVRLCSKFADNKLLPKLLEVLKKSMKGYFHARSHEIEKDICQFFERVEDQRSLIVLLELLKARTNTAYGHIVEAVAKVLDKHPNLIEYVIEMLYDNRRNSEIVYAILRCFDEMETSRVDARKLLSSIRINWWTRYAHVGEYLRRLLVKSGERSKSVLFEILQEKEKHAFALACLKEIGISNEELSNIFPKSPMLQIYNFLYSKARSSKIPKNLNQLWKQKEKLSDNMPGVTSKLEHLLLHIFVSFNFATLNVAPLKVKSADIVCLYPETLDLFIVGYTTGTLQDDLVKMDALVKEMQLEMPDLFHKCSMTPIIASSEVASISPSNEQYAAQNHIVIMQRQEIDTLLEMLFTNRQSREVIEYIKSLGEFPSSVPSM